ncbi:PTD012 family protein [Mesorhizobium sp. B2-3-5]|uniref:PTD012 family protein n=1 Tax=Mesorhizobium sp. B2-3-5 TaxID=2589958 RepID=UPI00112ACD7F|nr:PTD012 family protein [Mesorhizobium sp. B2-3-5]TPM25292.1 PTD012 family protein [Mesorhizobium sp. B2-3-5]
MRKSTKQGPDADAPKLRKGDDKARAKTGNKRLAEQIRKILAKHYASKYRAR